MNKQQEQEQEENLKKLFTVPTDPKTGLADHRETDKYLNEMQGTSRDPKTGLFPVFMPPSVREMTDKVMGDPQIPRELKRLWPLIQMLQIRINQEKHYGRYQTPMEWTDREFKNEFPTFGEEFFFQQLPQWSGAMRKYGEDELAQYLDELSQRFRVYQQQHNK